MAFTTRMWPSAAPIYEEHFVLPTLNAHSNQNEFSCINWKTKIALYDRSSHDGMIGAADAMQPESLESHLIFDEFAYEEASRKPI